MNKVRVLAISGSLRRDSYNRKLLKIAKEAAAAAGADVEEADLGAIGLPVYDGDIETAGFPESAAGFKKRIEGSQVLLFASPEYNHSISGALKNAIDWASRKGNSFDGKTAAVFGASTGPYGTVRGQAQLRAILAALNVLVLPQPQVFVGSADTAFSPGGGLKDNSTEEKLKYLIDKTLAAAVRKDG